MEIYPPKIPLVAFRCPACGEIFYLTGENPDEHIGTQAFCPECQTWVDLTAECLAEE